MTVEADIFNALKGLVSNRVYPDLNDAPTVTTPYIVYQEISGEVVNFMESAVASKKNGRFQIACWATTRAASKALALQEKLRALGYTAFVEETRTAQGVLFHVRVGPELERSNAENVRNRLEQQVQIKGMVTRYP